MSPGQGTVVGDSGVVSIYPVQVAEELLAVRIDRWLLAARVFKTRGKAQLACSGGRVRVGGRGVKASTLVKRSDVVSVELPGGLRILRVRDLAEKRLGPPAAQLLYDDESPPPPTKSEAVPTIGQRERGAGRPTKAERRALDRLLDGSRSFSEEPEADWEEPNREPPPNGP